MKTSTIYFIALFLTLLPCCSSAQNNPFWDVPTSMQVDSLKEVLAVSKNDTVNIFINRQIGIHYQELNRPFALAYYREMLKLAKNTDQPLWEAEAHSRVGYVSCLMQNYAGGLRSLLLARTMASEPKVEKGMWNPGLLSFKGDPYIVRMTVMADIHQHLGLVHYFAGEYSKALEYDQQVKEINDVLNDDALRTTYHLNKAESLLELDQLDSAAFELTRSIFYSDQSGFKKYKGLALYDLGRIHERRKNFDHARNYYRLSIETNKEEESPDFEGMGYQSLANLARLSGNIDSVFFFSRKALHTYLAINDTLGLIAAYASLSYAFDATGNMDSAYYSLQKSIAFKDALNKEGRIKNFQMTGFNEQFRLQELEAEQLRIKARVRTYSFISGITVLLLITGLFYRSYRRQKTDRITIEKSYIELKSTQAQLIQSEKMASLGELTAGIAHEIQNPLNFVNNFSEVNSELIEELRGGLHHVKTQCIASQKIDISDLNEADAILNDLENNQQKINHHGKRADAIVKGMLQHSRSTSGQKEPTDINALCDEYLRLAYHGLKARDKSFEASFHFEPDKTLPNVNVVPQDFGRVLLNLINNAFQAVSGYGEQPRVTVSTRKSNNTAEVIVADNGPGIPDNIKDKIFQPFFTTKPTGQGTGLGLSLSYDIIKTHGGELMVDTKENKRTAFIIQLPV